MLEQVCWHEMGESRRVEEVGEDMKLAASFPAGGKIAVEGHDHDVCTTRKDAVGMATVACSGALHLGSPSPGQRIVNFASAQKDTLLKLSSTTLFAVRRRSFCFQSVSMLFKVHLQ